MKESPLTPFWNNLVSSSKLEVIRGREKQSFRLDFHKKIDEREIQLILSLLSKWRKQKRKLPPLLRLSPRKAPLLGKKTKRISL